jgi:heme-degrading monooxygenase HmoA
VYARTTTVWGRPESIDDGIALIHGSVMPELRRMHGFIGLSVLADRESGRCIATSAWQSEDDMHASGPLIREVRDRAAQLLGGAPETAEWEIAVMHREHECAEGACVRVGWAHVDPERIGMGIELFKDSVLPAFEELDGFCSASLMIDRDTATAVVSTAFDSAASLQRHLGRLDRLRDATTEEAGARMLEECDFELAIAHLRVPELV